MPGQLLIIPLVMAIESIHFSPVPLHFDISDVHHAFDFAPLADGCDLRLDPRGGVRPPMRGTRLLLFERPIAVLVGRSARNGRNGRPADSPLLLAAWLLDLLGIVI